MCIFTREKKKIGIIERSLCALLLYRLKVRWLGFHFKTCIEYRRACKQQKAQKLKAETNRPNQVKVGWCVGWGGGGWVGGQVQQ